MPSGGVHPIGNGAVRHPRRHPILMRKNWADRVGSRMAVSSLGRHQNGSTIMVTFVLVPGAGGMAWNWSRVAPLMREAGCEVVAVNLPGDDPRAGLAEYS